MRWLIVLLVLANLFSLALFQGWLAPWVRGEREPERVAGQRHPERLRVLPSDSLQPRPRASTNPSNSAAGTAPGRAPAAANGGLSAPEASAAPPAASAAPSAATAAPGQGAPLPAAPAPAGSTPGASGPEARPAATPVMEPTPDRAPATSGLVPRSDAGAVCVAFGPLDEGRARQLQAALEAQGARVEVTLVEQAASWWVYVEPSGSPAQLRERLADVRSRGQEDAFAIREGPMGGAISLGLFRSESMARAFAARVAGRGVAGVQVQPRGNAVARAQIRSYWRDAGAARAAATISNRFGTASRDCA